MIYLIIIAVIFGLEYIIKNHVEKGWSPQTEKRILWGKILLRKYHNRGAAFNLGEKTSFFVAIVSLLMTAAITVLFILTLGQCGNRLLKFALSILLGGAFSNTYDRWKRKYVVDYFSFGTRSPKIKAIVYNLSDFCILIGCLIWALAKSE